MSTTTDLVTEVRQSVDRLTNRHDGVGYVSLEAALRDFNAKMDRIAVVEAKANACKCQEPAGFEINTRRNNGMLDFKANLDRVKKANACEEMLFETEGVLTNAGIREGVGQ